MPQISLYIDKETLMRVEQAAHKEKVSISKWVGEKLERTVKKGYPEGYFDLFGSIKHDKSFSVNSLSLKNDVKREKM